MNPVVQDYAWPRFVLDHIAREYLGPKLYDGFCLTVCGNSPRWA